MDVLYHLPVIIACWIICTNGWRTIYIAPSDSSSYQVSQCPVNHCYSLQDVISNQSYFFDSKTTLKLIPGRYDITERVGQLVIANVSHLTLKRSVIEQNVTLFCHPNATLGLTIIHSFNVTVSGLQLIHCSARMTEEALEYIGYELGHKGYEEALHIIQYLKHWLSSPALCELAATVPCKASVIIINNRAITMQHSTISHSQHIGLFVVRSPGMVVFGSWIAYNNINCIIHVFVRTLEQDETTISESYIMLGQATDISLTSGLNLFINAYGYITSRSCTKVVNVTFVNNRGSYGDLYLHSHTRPYTIVKMFIRNVSIIADNGLNNVALSVGNTVHFFDPYLLPQTYLYIEDSIIERGCVIIAGGKTMLLEMIGTGIHKSSCLAAVTKVGTCLLRLTNSTISNSYNNSLYIVDGGIEFSNKNNISGNQGTFVVKKGVVTFKKESMTVFHNNSAFKHESILYSDSSNISFYGNVVFINNKGKEGGAIVAYRSTLHFENSIATFIGNSADNGGAINLKEGSVINISNVTNINLLENKARHYGGGIYVEERGLWIRRRPYVYCFVELNMNSTGNIYFENNIAGFAGMALFGGWIDICIRRNSYYIPSQIFDFQIGNNNISFSEISSNPSRVCVCTNSIPNKYESSKTTTLFPGQTFEIEVVAVGQRFGVVPAIVRAEVENRQYSVIDGLQKLQDVGKQCTRLQYTIHSPNHKETIFLTVNKQYIPEPYYQNQSIPPEQVQFRINLLLKNCSLGFVFDTNRNTCVCHHLLHQLEIQCNTALHTINRKVQMWITGTPTQDIIINFHCPFDYCKIHNLSLNLSTPDDQCASNRSGILCGACQPRLSLVLGTLNCKKCSNIQLLLILPFALAGVALVVLLMVLNLTVSTGTINGLIFYANIVRANTATFFPGQTANTFLSWFIAWLNLDLGVETCFYDGLNAYAKTWLQFFFPLYIWLLATAIIVSSHYSKTAAKLCGKNSVQVLATLFFLSYAKILRVTITIFQPSQLHYLEDNTKKVIWNYDGNIDYLKGQHIPLFVTALLFLSLFFIPYTFTLLGIQVLQAFSHYKPFSWVNKLKPLIDAYTGPYKDKHRYWTCLLYTSPSPRDATLSRMPSSA